MAKYGKRTKYDYLRSGSIWDEPKDWMMSLRQEERTLALFWSIDNGSVLAEHVSGISLQAKGSVVPASI